jgi:hypothetical protein
MIGPVITTLAAGGGTLATALTRRAPADIALAVGVWAFIVVVWVIALWAARGTWRPLAQSTDGFVRLSIRRCRSVLEGLYAGIALYVIGFIGILWWKIHYLSMSFAELMSSWQVLVIGFAVSPILLFALLAVARRKRAELRAWRGMLGDVDNDAR